MCVCVCGGGGGGARLNCYDFSRTRCELMERLAEVPVGGQGGTLKVTKEEVMREPKPRS